MLLDNECNKISQVRCIYSKVSKNFKGGALAPNIAKDGDAVAAADDNNNYRFIAYVVIQIGQLFAFHHYQNKDDKNAEPRVLCSSIYQIQNKNG